VPTQRSQFTAGEDPRYAALEERVFAPLSRPAQVHVRHQFPTRLQPPPDEGLFVLMQAWEFGFLPVAWVEPIRRHVREVWCHSRYLRDVYLASGIPEERLQIIPHGIDPRVLHPGVPPYVFTTEAGAARVCRQTATPFVFLFVGGSVHRKGIDIVVDAYLREFAAREEVCLLIKDTCTQTAYRGMNQKERLLALANDPTRPAIVYLDDDLPTHQLAGLYTAADCLAQPYRGEAFCLPVLEAMACGLPVIVPEGGPTDDFVDETVGWRVPAERRPMGGNRVGDWECAGPVWMLEVSPEDLGAQMRQVYENREEAGRRGAAGAARVREGWTWEHATAKALARLESLTAETQRRRGKVEKQKRGKEQGTRGDRPDLADSALTPHASRLLSPCA